MWHNIASEEEAIFYKVRRGKHDQQKSIENPTPLFKKKAMKKIFVFD